MSLPPKARYVIVGGGIHGLSTAWHLGELLIERSEGADVVVLDKSVVGSGATGIACGVVRNNYYQPAMRALMAHSVAIWEENAGTLSYNPVGYMQISPEAMHEGCARIFSEQKAIGYDSAFIEGAADCDRYMKSLYSDWRAKGITSVLHEKRGGYANNMGAVKGLKALARSVGADIHEGVAVTGFARDNSGAVKAVETDRGAIECDQVVVAPGPWARDFWRMLELPRAIPVKEGHGPAREDVPMWRFWQLEEGVLNVDPRSFMMNDGTMGPVMHVDTDVPLHSDQTGKLITDGMWGIYYKPDFGFGGVQGGAMPHAVEIDSCDVAIDPYGPESRQFVSSAAFAEMWTSALAFCHKRFEGQGHRYRRERSGGIGCMTPDSFPVFDVFRENCYVIADSNHGFKMIGVGKLVAEELLGGKSTLLEPFRFSRFSEGRLHPRSRSPFPWS